MHHREHMSRSRQHDRSSVEDYGSRSSGHRSHGHHSRDHKSSRHRESRKRHRSRSKTRSSKDTGGTSRHDPPVSLLDFSSPDVALYGHGDVDHHLGDLGRRDQIEHDREDQYKQLRGSHDLATIDLIEAKRPSFSYSKMFAVSNRDLSEAGTGFSFSDDWYSTREPSLISRLMNASPTARYASVRHSSSFQDSFYGPWSTELMRRIQDKFNFELAHIKWLQSVLTACDVPVKLPLAARHFSLELSDQLEPALAMELLGHVLGAHEGKMFFETRLYHSVVPIGLSSELPRHKFAVLDYLFRNISAHESNPENSNPQTLGDIVKQIKSVMSARNPVELTSHQSKGKRHHARDSKSRRSRSRDRREYSRRKKSRSRDSRSSRSTTPVKKRRKRSPSRSPVQRRSAREPSPPRQESQALLKHVEELRSKALELQAEKDKLAAELAAKNAIPPEPTPNPQPQNSSAAASTVPHPVAPIFPSYPPQHPMMASMPQMPMFYPPGANFMPGYPGDSSLYGFNPQATMPPAPAHMAYPPMPPHPGPPVPPLAPSMPNNPTWNFEHHHPGAVTSFSQPDFSIQPSGSTLVCTPLSGSVNVETPGDTLSSLRSMRPPSFYPDVSPKRPISENPPFTPRQPSTQPTNWSGLSPANERLSGDKGQMLSENPPLPLPWSDRMSSSDRRTSPDRMTSSTEYSTTKSSTRYMGCSAIPSHLSSERKSTDSSRTSRFTDHPMDAGNGRPISTRKNVDLSVDASLESDEPLDVFIECFQKIQQIKKKRDLWNVFQACRGNLSIKGVSYRMCQQATMTKQWNCEITINGKSFEGVGYLQNSAILNAWGTAYTNDVQRLRQFARTHGFIGWKMARNNLASSCSKQQKEKFWVKLNDLVFCEKSKQRLLEKGDTFVHEIISDVSQYIFKKPCLSGWRPVCIDACVLLEGQPVLAGSHFSKGNAALMMVATMFGVPEMVKFLDDLSLMVKNVKNDFDPYQKSPIVCSQDLHLARMDFFAWTPETYQVASTVKRLLAVKQTEESAQVFRFVVEDDVFYYKLLGWLLEGKLNGNNQYTKQFLQIWSVCKDRVVKTETLHKLLEDRKKEKPRSRPSPNAAAALIFSLNDYDDIIRKVARSRYLRDTMETLIEKREVYSGDAILDSFVLLWRLKQPANLVSHSYDSLISSRLLCPERETSYTGSSSIVGLAYEREKAMVRSEFMVYKCRSVRDSPVIRLILKEIPSVQLGQILELVADDILFQRMVEWPLNRTSAKQRYFMNNVMRGNYSEIWKSFLQDATCFPHLRSVGESQNKSGITAKQPVVVPPEVEKTAEPSTERASQEEAGDIKKAPMGDKKKSRVSSADEQTKARVARLLDILWNRFSKRVSILKRAITRHPNYTEILSVLVQNDKFFYHLKNFLISYEWNFPQDKYVIHRISNELEITAKSLRRSKPAEGEEAAKPSMERASQEEEGDITKEPMGDEKKSRVSSTDEQTMARVARLLDILWNRFSKRVSILKRIITRYHNYAEILSVLVQDDKFFYPLKNFLINNAWKFPQDKHIIHRISNDLEITAKNLKRAKSVASVKDTKPLFLAESQNQLKVQKPDSGKSKDMVSARMNRLMELLDKQKGKPTIFVKTITETSDYKEVLASCANDDEFYYNLIVLLAATQWSTHQKDSFVKKWEDFVKETANPSKSSATTGRVNKILELLWKPEMEGTKIRKLILETQNYRDVLALAVVDDTIYFRVIGLLGTAGKSPSQMALFEREWNNVVAMVDIVEEIDPVIQDIVEHLIEQVDVRILKKDEEINPAVKELVDFLIKQVDAQIFDSDVTQEIDPAAEELMDFMMKQVEVQIFSVDDSSLLGVVGHSADQG